MSILITRGDVLGAAATSSLSAAGLEACR